MPSVGVAHKTQESWLCGGFLKPPASARSAWLVGVVAGFVLHATIGDDDALAVYELVAALFGVVFGGGLGAFYGWRVEHAERPSVALARSALDAVNCAPE